MKRLLSTFLLLSFPLLSHAQSPSPSGKSTPADKESCSVSGTVIRQDTGEPLSKARVTFINREKWDDSDFDLTDSQGQFVFDNFPCISYSMTVSHPGFVEAQYGQRKPEDPGAVLTLSPGQKLTGLIFKLQRTAVITGRVFDEKGELVEGAFVRAVRRTGRNKRSEFREAGSGTTNDLGEFRIYDLNPGRLYLVVTYEPWSSRFGFEPRQRRRGPKKGYPATYYPGTADPARAQAVAVGPGDELHSIDFRLQLTSMNTVSGRIVNLPKNADGGNANVFLNPRGSNLSSSVWNSLESSAKGGDFAIDRVPPGSYNLLAVYFDRDAKTRIWYRRELEVADSDIENLAISLPPSFTVPGHVNWEGDKPGDLGPLTAELNSTDENLLNPEAQSVQPDGSFLFRNVSEGEYRPMVVDASRNCFVKSAREGTLPMVDGKLAIHSGSDNSLEYVVSCRAGQVSGQVLNSDSLPATGVFVVLVPDRNRRDAYSNYCSATTDQYGRFILKGITPGDYKLFSWSSVDEGDWQDADFLKPYEDKGVSVHIEEGDRKSVDLALIEPPHDTPPANE